MTPAFQLSFKFKTWEAGFGGLLMPALPQPRRGFGIIFQASTFECYWWYCSQRL